MQNLNKKAMAESITTFILIILAVVATGFAGWSVMKLFTIGDIQSSPTFTCLEAQSLITPPVIIKQACLNNEDELEISVKRGNEDYYIDSLAFIIGEETWRCSSKSCGTDCDVLPKGKTRTYYITPEKNLEGKTIELYAGTCKMNDRKITPC